MPRFARHKLRAPPSAPAPRLRLLLPFRPFHPLGEGVPLAEDVDVLPRREGVQLEQRQRIAEGLTIDEAKLGTAIGRRLEQPPQRLERLFDVMARPGWE